MRINLQKFGLSTLTFSLATTLAVAGFSESANAQLRSGGASYEKSNNQPRLDFNAFFKNIDGSLIEDKDNDLNNNVGIFENAIEVTATNSLPPDSNLIKEGTKIFGETFNKIGLEGNDSLVFNLSAKRLGENLIEYQIYKNDNDDIFKIENPDLGIKFAPVEVSSFNSDLDLVNSIKDIIESSNSGNYEIDIENDDNIEDSDFVDGDFTNQEAAGVLGLAINKSLKFTKVAKLEISTDFGSTPSTSIPEPTTTLASIFALGFAGKFLRKSKKNNA
ncbi:MAG: hypothetical protein AAGM40_26045 [Cyanobacteria bacterium J06573_2]